MAKRTKTRIYWREQGGVPRAYADFRDYADVGGGRERLRVGGEKLATPDSDVAGELVAARLRELEERRRGRGLVGGAAKQATLKAFAREHLMAKAKAGRTTDRWLAQAEAHLEGAVAHFGTERDLASITVADVRAWAARLQELPSNRGGTLRGGTVRHRLNALSNLYRRAQGEGYVPPGYNPVAALMEKPRIEREEARWLEVHDGALLLEAARRLAPKRPGVRTSFAYPLLATFLLTGGRLSEVLGLEVADVSFDRKTVAFRRHQHRRLKTEGSARVVPLWPQLEEVLRPYADQRVLERGGRLLFPRFAADGQEAMITDFRKLLDAVAVAAGFAEPVLDRHGKPVRDAKGRARVRGTISAKMFRHTYCAARLQTLDQGAPVSLYTVSRELGHGSRDMVERVYSHLGQVRHRSEVIEYRVEQHADVLHDRLEALPAV